MKNYPADRNDFTLDDFRKQFEQIKRIGIKEILSNLPGMRELIPKGEDPEQELRHIQGMIDAMTKEERRKPQIINLHRCQRIARGSGTEADAVERFLHEFGKIREFMLQLAKLSMWERLRKISGLGDVGFSPN
jgi:signal recognition particle subunit SRP54